MSTTSCDVVCLVLELDYGPSTLHGVYQSYQDAEKRILDLAIAKADSLNKVALPKYRKGIPWDASEFKDRYTIIEAPLNTDIEMET